jgi:hypothetical protein
MANVRNSLSEELILIKLSPIACHRSKKPNLMIEKLIAFQNDSLEAGVQE